MQLRHIGIVTSDLDKSLDFYKRWFGCFVSRAMNESGDFISEILGYDNAEVKTVKISFPEGESQLELLSFQNPKIRDSHSTLTSSGLTHFAIKTVNLNQLYQEMLGSGISFISEPKKSVDGAAKVCFCKAPDNVYIELVELLK